MDGMGIVTIVLCSSYLLGKGVQFQSIWLLETLKLTVKATEILGLVQMSFQFGEVQLGFRTFCKF